MLLVLAFVAMGLACSPGLPLLEPVSVAVGVALAAAMLADAALGPGRAALRIWRVLPERHFAMGTDSTIRYEIANRGNVPVKAGIVESPSRTLFFVDDETIAQVPARGRSSAVRRVAPVARGRDQLGDLYVWYENGFGLLRRRVRVRAAQDVRVYPNLSVVERYGRLDVRNRLVEEGVRRMRMLGTGSEFESLREYQPGDAFRSVNWKATARRGRLMVTQYEVERSQSVMLLIDCGRLMTPFVGEQRKIDYAVTAALSLASIASLASDRVGAAAFARNVIAARAPRSTAASLYDLSELLYDIDARFEDADYAKVLAFAGRQLRRRSLVVLLTDVVDPISQSVGLAELATLARRHVVLCVFMSDEAVRATFAACPESAEDAYRLDVAAGLALERRAAAAALERQGVIVVDAPARLLTVSLLDEYVRIKQRGVL